MSKTFRTAIAAALLATMSLQATVPAQAAGRSMGTVQTSSGPVEILKGNGGRSFTYRMRGATGMETRTIRFTRGNPRNCVVMTGDGRASARVGHLGVDLVTKGNRVLWTASDGQRGEAPVAMIEPVTVAAIIALVAIAGGLYASSTAGEGAAEAVTDALGGGGGCETADDGDDK